MAQRLDRRLLVGGTLLAGALRSEAAAEEPKAQARPKKEPLPAALVREWVLVSHKDFERVKALYTEEPALLNAMWDWGGGDWESALGAAAHTGGREIALFLLEKGARFDLFASAMLGHLDVVKTALTRSPDLIAAKGPHGIPLVVHAKMGGEPAKEVLAYLEALAKARRDSP